MRVRAPLLILAAGWAHPRSRWQAGSESAGIGNLRSALVHAYDLFIWDRWMNDVSAVRQTPLDGKYKPGDSFLEECRQLTEPWKDNIQVLPR